jgi:ribosome assembly protein 1
MLTLLTLLLLLLLQVSPPLVAFKESVLSGGEAQEGVAIKPARVVEAATPSGCCVVRVKAHALPNATAALLDEHAHLLRELVEHHGSRQQQQQLQQGAQAAAAAASWRHQRRSIDGQDSSREASKFREAYDSSLAAATNKQLPRLLERAWLLGPRNVGPNIALCSPSACGGSSSSSSSLFDVPAAQVVKTSSKHNPAAAAAKAAAAPGSIPDPKHQHEQAAAANGLGSAHEHAAAASAAQDAAADAAEAAAQQLDVPFGRPSAAAMLARQAADGYDSQQPPDSSEGAAAAAAAAAAAGLAELWPHITSSVESGATAGFQLAAGAGPLCDEAMWGVVFELEVRLLLPAAQAAAAAAAAAGGGSGLDLAESVYGPFSGQVGWRV